MIDDLKKYMQRNNKTATWLGNQLDISKKEAEEKLKTGDFTDYEKGLIRIVIYSNF